MELIGIGIDKMELTPCLPATAQKLQVLEVASQADEILQLKKRYVNVGWPGYKDNVSP